MSLITEYFNYLEEYSKMYGENTIILMQVGSFYEIYSVNNKNEKIGNAEEVSQLLNIQLTRKNKKILEINRKNPYMSGVPLQALDKYLPVLLDNNYTVVLVDQVTPPPKPERKVVNIYSPGTIISKDIYCSYITVLYIEKIKNKDKYLVGISCIDISNGQCIVHEIFNDEKEILENIYSFLKCYHPREIIIYSINAYSYDNLVNFLELNDVHCHFYTEIKNEYYQVVYQNEYLSKIYKNDNTSLLTTIEFLDLENKIYGTISFISLIDFIYKHNENMLINLNKPEFHDPDKYLILMTNAVNQLDIFENKNNKSKGKYKCVYDVINNTITSIGRRKLKEKLLFPIRDCSLLEEKYNIIENISKLPERNILLIEKSLSEILDIEKLHRKMSIGNLNPCDFITLDIAYKSVIKLIDNFDLIKLNSKDIFIEFVNEYYNLFDLDEMSKYTLDDIESSFFKKNNYKELDELQEEILTEKNKLDQIAKEYSLLIVSDSSLTREMVKVSYIEKEGYYLSTTNVRANLIKKKVNLNNVTFIINKSCVKIISKDIQNISNNLINIKNKIKYSVREIYINIIKNFYIKYSEVLKELVYYIGEVDVSLSNFKVSKEFSYVKPKLKYGELHNSSVKIKGLRHPLVERINKNTKYIPNDIELDKNGMILYGLNFSGKSTLIKSIGIAIILAQAGMYVPCEEITISPFSTIITRLQGNDNILKGQSSFVVEMIELRNILKNANKNTIIIMDELCRGTESTSANAIVASSLLHLTKKETNFILATHLRFLSEYKPIKECKNIKIQSLSVKFEKDIIIFDRKLKDGACSELYGIEVAKHVGLDKSFIEKTIDIRDELIGKKKQVLSTKKSKYNSEKIIDKCEICNYNPIKQKDLPLDVHHIEFQCNANKYGIIDNFHKNELHNLVVLCKMCHQKVHQERIKIFGYITTSKGISLDYTILN